MIFHYTSTKIFVFLLKGNKKKWNLCILEDTKEEPGSMEPVNREQFEHEVPEERQTKICVSGLPSDVDEEFIQMFFESKRNFKGCSVINVEIDEEGTSAIVEFEEPDGKYFVLAFYLLDYISVIAAIEIFL